MRHPVSTRDPSYVAEEAGPELRPAQPPGGIGGAEATEPASTGRAPGVEGSLVRAAAEWRLIGLVFERPRPGWRDELGRIAAEIDDRSLAAAALAAAATASEGEHLRLFGPGGLVSPREVAYRPLADPGALLADLAALYGAFAFRPRAEEPIDHVAVECGFAGYLCLKEAFALSSGNREAARRTARARTGFLETHLAPIGAEIARRLAALGAVRLAECARRLAARVPAPPSAEARAARGEAAACPWAEGGCDAGSPPPGRART